MSVNKPVQSDLIQRIAAVGTYPPRRCGIGTFTADLVSSINEAYPKVDVIAMPINDQPEGYAYGREVRFELPQDEIDAYRRAADFLNINNVDVVSLQHEFGIFGGMAGSHILAMLRNLRMPVVTTLHTILRQPDRYQRRVMDELGELSQRLVVMSHKAVEFLTEIYKIPHDKIDMIPHGIPDTAFVDPAFYKDRFGVEGKNVILTFGLLSPNKGLETAIRALPKVVEQHPETVYMIVGATHPGIFREHGESYRHSLEMLAEEMGVRDNIFFYNRFVELDELLEFIGSADVYTTPYLNAEQITSGTLAYAVGAGKAVVSTPYWYAEELLDEGRGKLVPFKDPDALAGAISELLGDDSQRNAIRKKAFLYGREMIWPVVAQRYLDSFRQARQQNQARGGLLKVEKTPFGRPSALPPTLLTHLQRMTQGAGVLRDASYNVPLYAGGSDTADNARLLMAAVLMEQGAERNRRISSDLAIKAMSFLAYAWDEPNQRFRTHRSFEGQWTPTGETSAEALDQTQGFCLWALGMVLGRSMNEGLCGAAGQLFGKALPAAEAVEDLSACAATVVGIQEYLRRFAGDRQVQEARERLASRLAEAYQANASGGWRWFADRLNTHNATIPQALLMSGQWTSQQEWVEHALESLRWLIQQLRSEEGLLIPVGGPSGFTKDQTDERPKFPQWPGEACSVCWACLEAWRVTQEETFRKAAEHALEWFLGRNALRASVYDPATGGCRDALEAGELNPNQGGRATLSFLLALLEVRSAQEILTPPREEATALADRAQVRGESPPSQETPSRAAGS